MLIKNEGYNGKTITIHLKKNQTKQKKPPEHALAEYNVIRAQQKGDFFSQDKLFPFQLDEFYFSLG